MAIPAATTFDRPVVAIRGDIISSTGYARAARALATIISAHYDVRGVSLHEDRSDCSATFPGAMVDDKTLRQIALERSVIVIHHTTPDEFLPVVGAYNIGCFYWETNAIPRRLFWPEHIAAMNAMWAPTRFVARFITSCAYRGPVRVVPWAHDFHRDRLQEAARLKVRTIGLNVLETTGPHASTKKWRTSTFDTLRAERTLIFLAIQSLSPRKGLPILLKEWLRFVETSVDDRSCLLLKLNFRHAHNLPSDEIGHLAQMIERCGSAQGQAARIALISDNLDDEQISGLLRSSDCLVSASFGEGFGGPVVEALSVGTPVIAPRHTSLAELLPEAYPLQYPLRETYVQLRDLPEAYPPASQWFLPSSGGMADKFQMFSNMSEDMRKDTAVIGLRHAEAFCGRPVVEQVVARELVQAAEHALRR